MLVTVKAVQTEDSAPGLVTHREKLANWLWEDLRSTLFLNRSSVRPARLKQIAASEVDAFLSYLENNDATAVVVHGAEWAWEGLGEQAVLRMGATLRRFCHAHLEGESRQDTLLSTDGYAGALLEGYIVACGAIVLAEQERIRAALQRALSRFTVQLQTAAEVAHAASSVLDPDRLLASSVDLIRERFDFHYVGLFLVDAAGEWAVLRAGAGKSGHRMLHTGRKLRVGGPSSIGCCVSEGKAYTVHDANVGDARSDTALLPETQSAMALPLVSRGRVIGAMTIQSDRVSAFVEDVIGLQTLAGQLANAIENARLYAAAQEELAERKRAEAANAQLYRQVQRQANELEDRVMERTAELAAVNRELEAFAYSVSHDLRAPLRSMDGFSQALLEDYADKLDADGQDYLHRVRAASQRMGQLIDDLLKLSRIARSEVHHEVVNLSALAHAISTELQRRAPDRQVEVVIRDNLNASGDARLLRLVLENLLDNAWKFTSKKARARIELGAKPIADHTAYYVRDNGAGFDMAFADGLFGPFHRLHSKSEFEGNGIGLATAQRVIARHGGRIWAEGSVGQGATFYFTI